METLPLILQVNRSLGRLAETPRGELVKRASDLAETPWIRDALLWATDKDIRVIGRVDLIGPDRRTPWPSVLIEVRRRPRHSGQKDRRALVAIYVNQQGEWELSERESGVIPWGQWRGSREGKPSVLNGDEPDRAPDPITPPL